MGGSDSKLDPRAQFNGGILYVKTNQPYYYPGNTVYGKIYLRITAPQMSAHSMEIKVKGKELATFRYKKRYKDGDKWKTKTVHQRVKKLIFKFIGTALTFEGPLG